MHPVILSFVLSASVVAGVARADDSALHDTLARRLTGDRTGACIAAAVIDKDTRMAFVCANPDKARAIDAHTTFEIGSISKTMTAALLADRIARGEASLDDPLSKYLPEGVKAPEFKGKPVLLRHLVTHTSGFPALPSKMTIVDGNDPYARVTTDQLMASIEDVRLTAEPGTNWAYSNFAMMVLSHVLAKQADTSYANLIEAKLFKPLGMDDAFIDAPRDGVKVARGHWQTGAESAAWHFGADTAGVGGVRASLTDMIHYVEGQLGRRESAITPALATTQKEILRKPGAVMGMNWMIAPVNGREVHLHEGATGGFSALVVFDRKNDRGVVVLADTAMTNVGGLGLIGLHLLDDSIPIGEPRRDAKPDAALLDALAGEYQLDGGLKMTLKRVDDHLVALPAGQPEVELRHDSAGDFYPTVVDALLHPVRGAQGYSFVWHQGGGQEKATRISAAPVAAAFKVSAEDLKAYVGDYPLVPGFGLKVTARGEQLFVQGTGQQAFPVDAVAKDQFVAEIVGAEFTFFRDADGAVTEIELKQHGNAMRGKKQ